MASRSCERVAAVPTGRWQGGEERQRIVVRLIPYRCPVRLLHGILLVLTIASPTALPTTV
jgi:hypothetical protein